MRMFDVTPLHQWSPTFLSLRIVQRLTILLVPGKGDVEASIGKCGVVGNLMGHAFTRVLSSVSMIHMTSSRDISCTAAPQPFGRYSTFHTLTSVGREKLLKCHYHLFFYDANQLRMLP